ncbi:sodium-dependent transporter [Candidatus Woesearchaeota archaeon]|jgi:neurotransmitter:Na+ symporter, NSS family|nr:sodium-dependent transporter [Candidatus Woesearchaeota archaeon]
MRDRWSSRTIFILAAVGSAVGLGNVWRFPYLTYKFGGGAFLIPFLIALMVLGTPLLILEFALGQKLQKGAIHAFQHVHHRLGGIGFLAITASFIVVVYYAAILAWALVYFVKSFTFNLPWVGDAEGYFFGNVLQLTDSISQIGGVNWWLFLALGVVWLAIYYCVRKGVDSIGKSLKILVPLPLVLLGVLLIRGLTLEGSLTGIYYYIRPDFNALLSTDLWLAAASHVFFTLSIGFGIMIAYASYNDKKQDITENSYITSISDAAISLFAGFVVFAIVGYMAHSTASTVADVATAGPGLAFVVFPQALSMMPLPWLFSILFFLTLLTLGLDSAFSMVEGIIVVLGDFFKATHKKLAMIVCGSAFVLGIIFTTRAGLYFLDIVDHFLSHFGLVLVGLFECIAIGWIYGPEKLRTYINSVSDWHLGAWWDYVIKYFMPAVLIILLVVQMYHEFTVPYEGYPIWALEVGWLVVIIPLVIAIGMALHGSKTSVKCCKK